MAGTGTDVTSQIEANQNFTLAPGGADTATLLAGTTNYIGRISGNGKLILTSSATGGSTLTLAGGPTFVLPDARETETLTLSNGAWSVDATAAMAANQDIVLSGVPLTITLPTGSFFGAGSIDYTGQLSGSGLITVTGLHSSILDLPGGYVLKLGNGDASPQQQATIAYSNGTYTTNWNATVAAGEVITLNAYLSTLSLAAGTTVDRAGIAGNGLLAISSGAHGGAIFKDGSFLLEIDGTNETWDVNFGAVPVVSLSTPFQNNWNIALDYAAAATLVGPGLETYTGQIDGNGSIAVTASAAGGGTLAIAGTVGGVVADPLTLILPDAYETETITLKNQQWSIDYSAAIAANDDIVLQGNATATLAPGLTNLTGRFTGSGTLTLTSSASGGGTLMLADGTVFTLPDANETEVATLANGVWSIDATQALNASQDIVLSPSVPLTLEMGEGQFGGPTVLNDTGGITGNGELVVTFWDSNISFADGYAISLGYGDQAPKEQVTLTQTNGSWSADWSWAIEHGDWVDLNGASSVELQPGVVTDLNPLYGTGTVLVSTGASGGGTWISAHGTVPLPDANESETLKFDSNGWSIDYSSMIAGNQDITLSGLTATVTLAAGTTDYAGVINGAGSITVTAASAGATLVLQGGQRFVFASAGETQTLTLANGMWSADVTAALLANQSIVLAGNATAALPAGTTAYTGSITGAGILTLSTGSAGAATVTLDGTAFVLSASNETLPVTRANGVWTANISAAVAHQQAVTLTSAATLALSAGDIGASITGAGTVAVSSATGASTLTVGGTEILVLASAGESETATLAGGAWHVDMSAALAADQTVTLVSGVAATATLGAGVSDFTGTLGGSGTLTVTAGSGAATLLGAGLSSFQLSPSGLRETITVANGTLSVNLSGAIAASEAISLAGAATALLAAGTTTDTGAVTGGGSITVESSASAASTLVLDGKSFVLAAANEFATLTLAGGVWTEDFTAAINANQNIQLGSAVAAVLLPSSNTSYTGTIAGTGVLEVSTGTKGVTFSFDGISENIYSAHETLGLNFANGRLTTIDIGAALAANQFVSLSANGTATLQAGVTTETNSGSSLTGTNGLTLALTSAASSASTLVVGSTVFALASAQETEVFTYQNGTWSANATGAFLAGQNIALTMPTTVNLSGGSIDYTGLLTGTALTLAASAASTASIGGQSFILSAGETETLNLQNGVWIPDLTAAVTANDAITLTGAATLQLGSGSTDFASALTGTGSILVTAANGGTLVIGATGTTLALGYRSEQQTILVRNGIITGIDMTSSILANDNLVLTNVAAVVELPSGSTTYTGSISGNGTIDLIGGANGGTFSIGGHSYTVAAGATEAITVANGVWSGDITAEVMANDPVSLSGATILVLSGGSVRYSGAVSGYGAITVSASAISSLTIGGLSVTLAAGQSTVLTKLANGAWATDLTPQINANANITLTGGVQTLYLPGANVHYIGTITGTGQLAVISGATGQTFQSSAITLQVPSADETLLLNYVNGTVTSLDISLALQQNKNIVAPVIAQAALAGGTTEYLGSLNTSNNTLQLTGGAGGSTLQFSNLGALSVAAGITEAFIWSGGAWHGQIGPLLAANQPITLDGPAAAQLAAGITRYTGALSGNGILSLTASATASSILVLNGVSTSLAAGGSATILIADGVQATNVSTALTSDTAIDLAGVDAAILAAGTTIYTGAISGSGVLGLFAASSGATLVIKGQTIVLAGNESVNLIVNRGKLAEEVSQAVANNYNVTLSPNVTASATLLAGTTNDRGGISGSGTLMLTGAANGGSTVTIDGEVFTLAAGETEAAVLADGTFTTNVTAALLANAPIALGGAALAVLPGGTVDYTAALSGSAALVLSANGSAGSTLTIAGNTFVLTAGETETLTVANGIVATVDASAALAADRPVTLLPGVLTTTQLPAGPLTGTIAGEGMLRVTSANLSGGSTLTLNGQTFTLSSANETYLLKVSATGVWTQDVTTAMNANQNVALGGNQSTLELTYYNVNYAGVLSGTGQLAVSTSGSAESFVDGSFFQQLDQPDETIVIDFVRGAVTAVDITNNLANNTDINLRFNAVARLAAGTTVYTGDGGRLVDSNGVTLTLTAANASNGSTLVAGGTQFVLGQANEVGIFVYNNGWTQDVSSNLAANKSIDLTMPTIATLAAGLTAYTGSITGTSSFALTAGASGASTITLSGQSFIIPQAGETQLFSQASGIWTANVSAVVAASEAIILDGGSTVATLAAGLVTDTASLIGTGTLALTSSGSAASTLSVDGQTFVLGQANETENLILANGVITVDVSQAIERGQALVLNGAETVLLPASGSSFGYYKDQNSITGTGSLIVTSAGSAALQIDNSYVVFAAGQTLTLTEISANSWSEDITQAVRARQAIELTPYMAATLKLAAGTTTYTGPLTGSGTLSVTAAKGSGTDTLALGTQDLVIAAGASEVLEITNGTATSVDVSSVLAGNETLTLLQGANTSATLATGNTQFTAPVNGSGALTLTASGSGVSTLTIGADAIVLDAGQTEIITDSNGIWTANITSAVEANAPIVLSSLSTITLGSNTSVNYTAALTGAGEIIVTEDGNNGTLTIDGQTLILQRNLETVTLIRSASGTWVTDITAAILASDAVVLNGNAIMSLGAGSFTDTAAITGAGTLTLSTGASGGGTLTVGGQSFVVPDANESLSWVLMNGSWNLDDSAAISAGHDVVVEGSAFASLTAGKTTIASLSGGGTQILRAPGSGSSVLSIGTKGSITVASGQTVQVLVDGTHLNVIVTQEIADNASITLGSDASAFLSAGTNAYSGKINGNGELTLYGSTSGASTIAVNGTTYTIAQDGVLGLQFINGVASVLGEISSNKIDITAAIDANDQSIVLNGGKYIIYVPTGQTVSYSGVLSGTGTIEVAGGGTLIVTNTNTVTLPADQQRETVSQVQTVEMHYDGLDLGRSNQNAYLLSGHNAAVVTIDAGTTLDFGTPAYNPTANPGTFADYVSVYANLFNLDNVAVNGTLGVYYSGSGYALAVGEISGTGVWKDGIGSVFLQGDNSFSGYILDYGINFGGGFSAFQLTKANVIFDTQILAVATEGPTTAASNTVTLTQTIYSDGYTASILNQGYGALIFTGIWSYTDNGSANPLNPSLSDPALNYTYIPGDYSERDVVIGHFQQFGDGTNATYFLPGSAITSNLDFSDGGTLALDYKGVVSIDSQIGDAYGFSGHPNNGSLIIVGTPGNHIILTEQADINGVTDIQSNAILQLGDGTVGVSYTTTLSSYYGPVAGLYQTSGGNGGLLTADSSIGNATDTIIDDGELIVDNVANAVDGVGAITLSHITGSGSFYQEGTELVSLLEDTAYTGATLINDGTLAIYESAPVNNWIGIAHSSGVTLQHAGATLDISHGYDETIQDLIGADGSVVALGGNTLTVGTADSTVFAGNVSDGGLYGGTGGALIKIGSGTLTLAGNDDYTGATTIRAGALALAGISLASARVTVDANAVLSGNGSLRGALVNDGMVAVNAGTLAVAGAVSGHGTYSVAAGGTLSLAGGGGLGSRMSGVGSLLLGSGGYTLSAGETVALADIGIGAGSTLGGFGDLTGHVANAGTLSAVGGTLTVGGPLSGSGVLIAAGGAEILLAGGGSFGAASGAGTLELAAGTMTVSGGIDTVATVLIERGATLSGSGTWTGAVTNGGTIAAQAGTLTLNDLVGGTGTLSAAAGAILALSGRGSFGGALTGAGMIKIGAALSLTAGATISAADIVDTASMHLGAGASLTNAAGDTFTMMAAAHETVVMSGATGDRFTNAGTLIADGAGSERLTANVLNTGFISSAGSMRFVASVINDGVIADQSGVLSLNQAVSGSGTIEIGASATTVLGSGTSAHQTIVFEAASGLLDINRPSTFQGTIADFAGQDHILLVGSAATSLSYAKGVLTVLDGASVVGTLALAGQYSLDNFKLSTNPHGDAVISYVGT